MNHKPQTQKKKMGQGTSSQHQTPSRVSLGRSLISAPSTPSKQTSPASPKLPSSQSYNTSIQYFNSPLPPPSLPSFKNVSSPILYPPGSQRPPQRLSESSRLQKIGTRSNGNQTKKFEVRKIFLGFVTDILFVKRMTVITSFREGDETNLK